MVQGHSENKRVFRRLRSGTKESTSLVVWGRASAPQILGTDRMECTWAFPKHVGHILKRTDAVLWMWRNMPLCLVLLGYCVDSSIRSVTINLIGWGQLDRMASVCCPRQRKATVPRFEGGHMCLHWWRVGTGEAPGEQLNACVTWCACDIRSPSSSLSTSHEYGYHHLHLLH